MTFGKAYPNGTAAAEEGDREDDRPKHHHHNGNDGGVVFREGISDVIKFEQWNSANNDKRDSSDLKQTYKTSDIVYLIGTLIFLKSDSFFVLAMKRNRNSTCSHSHVCLSICRTLFSNTESSNIHGRWLFIAANSKCNQLMSTFCLSCDICC